MARPAVEAPSRSASAAELLTEEFYLWELRGRGWQLWDAAVSLQPPFRPFFGHTLPPLRAVDDGRRQTRVGALVERFAAKLTDSSPPAGEPVALQAPEPIPDLDEGSEEVVELRVALPPDHPVTKERAERLLLALGSLRGPVAFEILAAGGTVSTAFAVRASDRDSLRRMLEAYFPEAAVTDAPAGLGTVWESVDAAESVIADFGLSREFMVPLKRPTSFEVDPLIALVGAVSDLGPHELGLFQALFQASGHPWAPSIFRAVTDGEGDAFFADAPEILALAREKVGRPLFAAVIRVAARAPARERAWEIVRGLGGALAQLASPVGNELIPLANDDYPDDLHAEDVLRRATHRSGMLLNAEELVSLVHLPSASVRSEALAREATRTKAAPAVAVGHALILGENTHRGKTVEVTVPPGLRLRHTYVIGASGTGKSTLLLRMILQDLEHGEGLAVLDPHGDLIDEVVARIPEKRLRDVVLFDPADEEFPIGMNVLEAHSERERTLLASDLVAVFRRLATSWGDQMTSVLGNAVLAFLESDRGGTLVDLRRFLVDATFQKEFLRTVGDPEVVYYFKKEYPLLRGHPEAPILTRLDAFLRPKLIRRIVGQREGKLDLASVMDGRKVFLAKLAQGLIGEENAALLGALLVAKFQQLASARQAQAKASRQPFYLYLDEFHEVATPSIAALLTGARKYSLGLILAHHELRQLQAQDVGLASAVLTNPAVRLCFRVGEQDAKVLAEGFTSFNATDLVRLGVGEAIGRMERADWDFTLATAAVQPVDTRAAAEHTEEVVARSRAAYARPRAEVEAMLGIKRGVPESQPEPEEPRRATEARPAPSAPPVERQEASATNNRKLAEAQATPTVAPRAVPKSPPLPGRGGPEHKYLQHLVKRLAEDRGWKATIEADALAGIGQVDVALERDGSRVACEITVTTSGAHELGNIQKCLAAGYDEVLVIASQKQALRELEGRASDTLESTSVERVRFLSPEELVGYLDEKDAAAASRTQTVRGYKVKVNYKPVTAAENNVRKEAIARVLAKGMRRVKGARPNGPPPTPSR